METNFEYRWVSWLIFVLLMSLIFIIIMAMISGIAWTILELSEYAYWMTLLAFLLAVSAGMVSTYSFVSFMKTRQIRNLMLLLLGLNIIMWAFLYLVTHPASVNLAPLFSSRNRNRTMGFGLVLIIVPSILLGSFSGTAKATQSIKSVLILWGAVILPIISLWFLFSPEPVFMMTEPGSGGVEGITPQGMVLSMVYLFCQIIAFLRSAQRWRNTRNIHDLSLFMALTIWIFGTVLIILLWDPFQIAELLWFSTIIAGFLIIGIVQFITSIVTPHKKLEGIVKQQTRELTLSKQESEFYLNLWTHKMGNILQAVVTYLDVLEYAAQNSEDDRETRSLARRMSKEATRVNYQVLQLSQIKESFNHETKPVEVVSIINRAASSSYSYLGIDTFTTHLNFHEEIYVVADDILELVFLSAIIYIMKKKIDGVPLISISHEQTDSHHEIVFTSRGEQLPKGEEDFLHTVDLVGNPSLDLDLFT
ncbi:MAG: hypothetical protein ACTSV2_08750, partial [Candidatus Thorarchaeota archaeon]